MEGQKMRKIKVDIEVDPQLYMEEFMDVVRNSIDSSHILRKNIADELDVSPSMLSRMLNENPEDTAYFPLYKLPILLNILKDQTILDWLNCKFKVGKPVIQQEINSRKNWYQKELEKLTEHEQLLSECN